MKDDNLPPGVSACDIPGNTPRDDEWEQLFAFLADTGLEPGEITALVSGAQPLADHMMLGTMSCSSALAWMEETSRLLRLLTVAWASSQVEQSDA